VQGGGYDREWYEPLTEEGHKEFDSIEENTIGCHTGPFYGLNVGNPQPGYEYCWQLNDPREVLKSRLRGGEVVEGGDPEFSIYNTEDPNQTTLDTSQLYSELVLIRTPIEMVRAQQLEEQQRAENMVYGTGEDFIDQASPLEADYGRRGGRAQGATRFFRNDHVLEVEEDGKTAVLQTPRSGPVRR